MSDNFIQENSDIITLRAMANVFMPEALDPVGQEDDDVDNDGDSDKSDEYLKKRRKAVGSAIDKRKKKMKEAAAAHISDDDEEEITEKKVKNKVVINPEMKESKDYDPMEDDEFDHDEAEENRGVSGKNNPKGGRSLYKKKKVKKVNEIYLSAPSPKKEDKKDAKKKETWYDRDERKRKEHKEEVENIEEKNWIQGAIKKPGALKKELGVPEDKNIPADKLKAAAKKGGKEGQRARLAITLKGLNKEEVEQVDEIAPALALGLGAAAMAPWAAKKFLKPQADKALDNATKNSNLPLSTGGGTADLRKAKQSAGMQVNSYDPEGEQLNERPYQVMGYDKEGGKEKKVGKPVKSRKYADARAAELSDTHKKTGGKYRSQYVEDVENVEERYKGSKHRPPAGWKPYGGDEKGPVPEVDATAKRIDAIRKSIKKKK